MAKLSIEIPDTVVDQVQSTGDTLETVILKALDAYLERQLVQTSQEPDITQTKTWQLCGRFVVAGPAQEELSECDRLRKDPGVLTSAFGVPRRL